MLSALKKAPGKNVKISAQWAPFLASMLLSLTNYKWAKNFIQSEAWVFFNSSLNVTTLKVPNICPGQLTPNSSLLLELVSPSVDEGSTDVDPQQTLNEIQQEEISQGKKGRLNKKPLVESEVRRSSRLKSNNKGFKPGTCLNKKCLACSPNPPDLSLDLIKDLGVNLCQIDENLLSESSLNQKKKNSGAQIGKKTNADVQAQDAQKKLEGKKKVTKKKLKDNRKPDEVDIDVHEAGAQGQGGVDAQEQEGDGHAHPVKRNGASKKKQG